MGWLINVGASFAHVSPTYTYTDVRYTDTYSDIIDLIEDVLKFYVIKTIKQCYKVVFSMHMLGKQCQTSIPISSFEHSLLTLALAQRSDRRPVPPLTSVENRCEGSFCKNW